MPQTIGTITALNGIVSISTEGESVVGFNITGTWVANVVIEATVDDTNWFIVQGVSPQSTNIFSIFAQNLQVLVLCGGYSQVRLRASAFTSGIINVFCEASVGSNLNLGVISGVISTYPPSYAAGNIAQISLSTTGAVRTEKLLSSKQTYSASIVSLTPPATPTDMVVINGSATKTLRITKIELSATQTLSGTNSFFIVLRSSSDSGGTSSTITSVPHDSNNSVATAMVKSYTANPTLGATIGTLRAIKMFTPAVGTLTTPYIFDFTNDGVDQGIVLRGAAQQMALNFNGAALPGGLSISCNIDWSEE